MMSGRIPQVAPHFLQENTLNREDLVNQIYDALKTIGGMDAELQRDVGEELIAIVDSYTADFAERISQAIKDVPKACWVKEAE
jgi:5-carboxymethyl-2-hydroxymuconate isomerase